MRLSFDVLGSALGNWISIVDLAVFDSAVSNKANRIKFLETIANKNFILNRYERYSSSDYFDWMVCRNMNSSCFDFSILSKRQVPLSDGIKEIIKRAGIIDLEGSDHCYPYLKEIVTNGLNRVDILTVRCDSNLSDAWGKFDLFVNW